MNKERLVLVGLAALLVFVMGLNLSNHSQTLGPEPGDAIKPVLVGTLGWTAGRPARVMVSLQAQGPDDPRPRLLGFIRELPQTINPTAAVTFFDGERQLGAPVELVLSYRCCGGMYQSSSGNLAIPDEATRANLVVMFPASLPDVTVERLERTIEIGRP